MVSRYCGLRPGLAGKGLPLPGWQAAEQAVQQRAWLRRDCTVADGFGWRGDGRLVAWHAIGDKL